LAVATSDEILAALADYRERCNANAKLTKMLRTWSRRVQFVAVDTDDSFTVEIDHGVIVRHGAGADGEAELVISGTSEDLCDMLWGDLNPVQKYLSGEIKIQGSADDVMRIDAMASVLWSDT
jgi:putative sterol carrier protein